MKKAIKMKLIIVSAMLLSCGSEGNANRETEIISSENKSAVYNGTDLKVKKVLSNKIEILIPTHFTLMSKEDLLRKYPGSGRPTEVYTNDIASTTIGFNLTNQAIEEVDLAEYLNVMKQAINGAYANAKWYGQEVKTINGRKIGILEFESPVVDGGFVYNMMFFSVLEGKLLTGTINFLSKDKKEWVPIGRQVIASMKH